MGMALLVAFTILEILVVGYAVARSAPPQWQLCELVVLAAVFLLVRAYRDYLVKPSAVTTAYSDLEPDWAKQNVERRLTPRVAGKTGNIGANQSVEQIAYEMVTQAFRQVSMKCHPDHGGDSETMQRVNAARDLLLGGLRRG